MTIEVELRSFLTREQYETLLSFFRTHGQMVSEDEQETLYLDAPGDLRIQRGRTSAKLWLKKGRLHDDAREEIEIPVRHDDFEKLERLFLAVGFPARIKWLRRRIHFSWEGIDVMLDDTKGYGCIIELEKRVPSAAEEDGARALLQEKFQLLHIPLTPRKEFEEKFEFYKKHWKQLIAGDL